MFCFLRDETKAALEVNLVNIMAISSLKLATSSVSDEADEQIMTVGSNIVG